MHRQGGFTLFELLVGLSLFTILSAVALPVVGSALSQNSIVTAQRAVVGELQRARLAAVARSGRVRVVFDCPSVGAFRMLTVTGDSAVDDASDRCDDMLDGDGAAVWLPSGVTFSETTTLEFDGRGDVTPLGTSAPVTLTIESGSAARAVTVTGAGRISGE